jgi:hypothetical protein
MFASNGVTTLFEPMAFDITKVLIKEARKVQGNESTTGAC